MVDYHVLSTLVRRRKPLPAVDQDIRFCTTADGVKLAYAVSGEGPPLVMSPTWLSHLDHQWRSASWQPWLEAFSRDHKLLRYDARGCGLSDWDADDLSFEAWIRDFECVIDAAAPRSVFRKKPFATTSRMSSARFASSTDTRPLCGRATPASA